MRWNAKLDNILPLKNINKLPLFAPIYFLKNSKKYIISFLALTACSVMSTIAVFLSTYLISDIISNISTLEEHRIIGFYLLIYILLTLTSQLLDFFTRRYAETYPSIYKKHQILRFYKTIGLLNFTRFFNYSKEKMLNLVEQYLGNVEKFLSDWFWSTSRNITRFIIIMYILISQSLIVFTANIIYIVIFLAISFYLSSKMAYFVKRELEQDIKNDSQKQNFFLNFNTVKRLRILPFSVDALKKTTMLSNDRQQEAQAFHSSRWFLQLNLFNIMFIFTFFFGVIQVMRGELELGFLLLIKYAFDNLSGVLIYVIEYFVSLVRQKEDSLYVLKELKELFPKETETQMVKSEIKHFSHLELKGISCEINNSKASEIQILIPHFSLKKGESIGIIGESGSGKSTTLNILLKLINYKGSYTVNDLQAEETNIETIMTLITSTDPLFNLSFYDNVTLGESIDPKKLEILLDKLKISKFLTKLDTRIGDIDTNLSGGQLQRLRLLRGLLVESEIYLLDEAFNFIDKENKREIIEFVREYLSDKSVIYITHNRDELDGVDKVYEFSDHSLKLIS